MVNTVNISENAHKDSGLKERLVAAGAQLLRTHPIQNLSLREVARLSGVSQTAPYRHFKDKEGLLAAIACEGFSLLRQGLDAALANEGTAQDKLMAMAKGYVKFGEEHPEHLRLMFGPYVTPGPEHPELFVTAKSAFLGVVSIIQQCQKAGVVGAGDPFLRAMHTWMSLHGFTVLYLDSRCDWLGLNKGSSEVRVELFAKDMLQGLARPLVLDKPEQRLQMGPIEMDLLKQAGIQFEISYESK